jgi:hypothetical protein
LSPLQVGVASPAGMERSYFEFQTIFDSLGSDSSYCALFLDFANAFNSINRDSLFKQVRLIMPSIAKWVEFCYSGEPLLFVGNRTIKSSCGVQQGDPLGPLLFAIAIHPLVLRIQSECPSLLLNKWYLDDGTIVGKTDDVRQALRIVQEECALIGLHLNESKSILFWGSMDLAKLDCFPEAITRTANSGVKFLGVGAGSVDFVNKFAHKKVESIGKLLEAAKNLEDPQMELLLLRSCIGLPKFAFLLRMCPPEQISLAISSLDGQISSFLCHILNLPDMTDSTRFEISLPISKGGLGIPIVSHMSPIQYMAARRNYVLSLSIVDLTSCANKLNDRIQKWNKDLELENQVLIPSYMALPSHPQAYMSDCWYKHIKKEVEINNFGNQSYRILSNFNNPAKWTVAPPISSLGLVMEPAAFRSALRFRLGLKIHGISNKCNFCSSTVVDCFGWHDSRCKPFWHTIHNVVRDKLFLLMKSANFDVKKEVANLFDNGTVERPADILFASPSGQSICLDVSCVSFNVPDGFDKRNSEKLKKYGKQCEDKNLYMQSLAFNNLGELSDEFIHFLKMVSRGIADGSSESSKFSTNFSIQQIQFCIMKAIGRLFVDRFSLDFN